MSTNVSKKKKGSRAGVVSISYEFEDPASSGGVHQPNSSARAPGSFHLYTNLCETLINHASKGAKMEQIKKVLNKNKTNLTSSIVNLTIFLKLLLPQYDLRRYFGANSDEELIQIFSKIFNIPPQQLMPSSSSSSSSSNTSIGRSFSSSGSAVTNAVNNGDTVPSLIAHRFTILSNKLTKSPNLPSPSNRSSLSLQDIELFLEKLNNSSSSDINGNVHEELAGNQNENIQELFQNFLKNCTKMDLFYVLKIIQKDLKTNADAKWYEGY